MTPTLTIQLDCSERLLQVLGVIAKAMSKQETTEVVAIEEKPTKSSRPTGEKDEPAASHEGVAETVKEEAKEEAETKVEAPAPKTEISDKDLRVAMKECRLRVLGDNINDPIMKTTLNDKMRAMVKMLGYESSTEMPQDERVQFLEFLRTVTMDTNNDLTF